MRQCSKCGSEFEPKTWQVKRHDAICLICCAQYKREWKAKNPGHITEQDREQKAKYNVRPEVVARRQERRKLRGYRSQKNSEQLRKRRARWTLTREIIKGAVLRQPCIKCGDQKSQAHHHDYDKPLDVIWLCLRCHLAEHGKKLRGRIRGENPEGKISS